MRFVRAITRHIAAFKSRWRWFEIVGVICADKKQCPTSPAFVIEYAWQSICQRLPDPITGVAFIEYFGSYTRPFSQHLP